MKKKYKEARNDVTRLQLAMASSKGESTFSTDSAPHKSPGKWLFPRDSCNFTRNPPLDNCRISCNSTKNGDIIGGNLGTRLVKYNDEGQLLRHRSFCNSPFEVVMYTESLLSLPSDNPQV
ncbi:hypothetical protein MTR_4g023100 [Medicago truncatula]|uniref:Uncharacterized protein n=1 Tax=Medicago truncatula TaxID=3880 RepID=G7JVS9_MEDTR|nr:hypothetical protein MTR_4g023100 [Medicago truncatula]